MKLYIINSVTILLLLISFLIHIISTRPRLVLPSDTPTQSYNIPCEITIIGKKQAKEMIYMVAIPTKGAKVYIDEHGWATVQDIVYCQDRVHLNLLTK